MATAIIVAYAGIRKALKDLKGSENKAAGPGVEKIVGGTIMETTTLLMWSESNKQVVEAVEDVLSCIKANTEAVENMPEEIASRLSSVANAINYNTEAVRDMMREYSETRHEIVRLRDSMERRR